MIPQTRSRALLLALLLPALGHAAGDHAHHGSHLHGHDGHDHHDHGQVPIGVMGGHLHRRGDWMTSYRHMFMEMSGNRSGTSDLSTQQVLAQFPVAPLRMKMQMEMFGAMFAPSDDLTMMLMIPIVELEMDHVNRMGVRFATNTRGVGDLRLTGLRSLKDEGRRRVHLNFGLSAPTGSIDETGPTPLGAATPLPYPMQLGSGTWDLHPGITFLDHREGRSFGAQITSSLRLGRNHAGYSLGNRFGIQGWAEKEIGRRWSASLRLAWNRWGDVDGADRRLNTMVVPTARADLRGGDRLDLGIGIAFQERQTGSRSQRLALEYLLPLRQDLDGPQLEVDHTVVLGWQASF